MMPFFSRIERRSKLDIETWEERESTQRDLAAARSRDSLSKNSLTIPEISTTKSCTTGALAHFVSQKD